jgi:putative PEP-CTERM system histidine kinase
MLLDIPVSVPLHAAVAVLYAVLAAIILLQQRQTAAGKWLGAACGVTALWGASVAWDWVDPLGGAPGWLELARAACWIAFVLHLCQRAMRVQRRSLQAFITIGLLAAVLIAGLPVYDVLTNRPGLSLWSAVMALRLGCAIGSILLLENLYFNTPPEARWHINLLCIALGGLAAYDLLLYADGLLYHHVSPGLLAGRAAATALVAPLLAIGAARNRRWKIDIHVSRDVVFHSTTLIGSGIFLLSVAAVGELFRHTGSDWGHVADVALVFGGILLVAVLVTSATARSHLRAAVVNHFFSHRYDYRREWMRCIETLTAPEAHTGLHQRAIRAVAEVVDSPAGALFVRPPQEVAFQWAGSWNMPSATLPVGPGHALIARFRKADRAIVLTEVPDAAAGLPDLARAWLAVPLDHLGALIGFVVLAQPRAKFKLDPEVFDLLRVVGREVASRIAEQRAAQILSQTLQLREYSQRFAFVVHDIKNVSGQLSMLLTNAETHADNPAFQRDMLATVRASVGRITRLLARLQPERQERRHALIVPGERMAGIVDALRLGSAVPVLLTQDGVAAGVAAGVAMDPDSFDAVITHLLRNAIEAAGDEPVRLRMRQEELNVVIDVIDCGPGMTPEFVRDELFRPLASTKSHGHGIGAYQARELLREAGGDLLVLTRPGNGTTMRILLPRIGSVAQLPVEA